MKFDSCKYDHLQLADQFLKMAEKFMPYAADEKNELDMSECNVVEHACGTTACHGGYAILALNIKSRFYDSGANALARYLGFPSREKLEVWARNNPQIWGNDYGDEMFSSGYAFGIDCYEMAFLKHIVSHYLSVAKRLMEIKE